MLRRLFLGLVLGLLVGGLAAAALVQGLHITTFGEGGGGALFGYLAAVVTGVATGLVAGKPIWAPGAKVEAGLKAFFGALISAGLLFALRQWGGGVALPVSELTPVGMHVGDLPVVALPVVAALLGAFFGIDNTPGDDKSEKSETGGKKRVATAGAAPKGKARVASDEDVDEEGAAAPAAGGKRKNLPS